MNIERKKLESKRKLQELIADCETILERANSALTDIDDVDDEESAKAFDKKHDGFENGLKHIILF